MVKIKKALNAALWIVCIIPVAAACVALTIAGQIQKGADNGK